MSPNHALQRTAPGGGGCRAISRLPRPQQSLSLGSLDETHARWKTLSRQSNGVGLFCFAARSSRHTLSWQSVARLRRAICGRILAVTLRLTSFSRLSWLSSSLRGFWSSAAGGAVSAHGGLLYLVPFSASGPYGIFFSPNQSMSQRPHSEISPVCLPRHPAVAYLFLVRPVTLSRPYEILNIVLQRNTRCRN